MQLSVEVERLFRELHQTVCLSILEADHSLLTVLLEDPHSGNDAAFQLGHLLLELALDTGDVGPDVLVLLGQGLVLSQSGVVILLELFLDAQFVLIQHCSLLQTDGVLLLQETLQFQEVLDARVFLEVFLMDATLATAVALLREQGTGLHVQVVTQVIVVVTCLPTVFLIQDGDVLWVELA